MTRDSLVNDLGSRDGSTLEYPFGPDAAVFKVAGKIFALASLETEPIRLSLKCDPDEAVALRLSYSAVQPGYHLNKKHWNTVTLDGSLPDDLISQLIHHSYELIVKRVPKRAARITK